MYSKDGFYVRWLIWVSGVKVRSCVIILNTAFSFFFLFSYFRCSFWNYYLCVEFSVFEGANSKRKSQKIRTENLLHPALLRRDLVSSDRLIFFSFWIFHRIKSVHFYFTISGLLMIFFYFSRRRCLFVIAIGAAFFIDHITSSFWSLWKRLMCACERSDLFLARTFYNLFFYFFFWWINKITIPFGL